MFHQFLFIGDAGESIANEFLPPYQLNAKNPEDIFLLESIFGQEEQQLVNSNLYLEAKFEKQRLELLPWKYQSIPSLNFIVYRDLEVFDSYYKQAILKNKDDYSLKLLIYCNYLAALLSLPKSFWDNPNKLTNRLIAIPPNLQSILLNRYATCTSENEKRYSNL